MRMNSQSTMVIELEDGLIKRLEVESNLSCAAGTGRLPEQYPCSIGGTMEDFASSALKSRGTL
jgi:activator of 2-hydroxyglutaryl-CoA dehydratase